MLEYRDALKTPVGLLAILSETGGEARGPRRGGSSGVLTVGSWEDDTEDCTFPLAGGTAWDLQYLSLSCAWLAHCYCSVLAADFRRV